jgi:hypothetical protein
VKTADYDSDGLCVKKLPYRFSESGILQFKSPHNENVPAVFLQEISVSSLREVDFCAA